MLPTDVIDVALAHVGHDAETLTAFLREHSLVDTDPGDAILGYLAGNVPDFHRAVVIRLAAGE